MTIQTATDISLNFTTKSLFSEYLNNDAITEIAVNKYGSIWIEDNDGWKEYQNQEINKNNCLKFANAFASYLNQKSDAGNSILGGTLPSGERVQIIRPPAVDDKQFSITIRKPSQTNFTLSDYENFGFFKEVKTIEVDDELDIKLSAYLDEKNYQDFFRDAVKSGKKNIIIAGATGSGKTTFMKSLISEIPDEERLITIEDVRELFIQQPNHVNLLYPSEQKADTRVTPALLLKSCLRMKPDRILLAELRSGEAFDYLNVISSGHGGSITSLHAGNKDEVIRRLILMTLQNHTGALLPFEAIKEIIKETIDIIVHIDNHKGKRLITSIYFKFTEDKKANYETNQ